MKKEKLSFELAMRELDQLTSDMQSDDMTIDQSLKRFERGLYLVAYLKKHLEELDNKVKEIKVRFKTE